MSRQALLGMALLALSIGAAAGWLTAYLSSPCASEPLSSRSPADPPDTPPGVPAGNPNSNTETSPQEAVLRGELASLESQLSMLQQAREAYETDLWGVPVPWPDDLPEKFQPEGFKKNVEAAIANCNVDAEVEFNCAEPPCFMMVRTQQDDWWSTFINNCPDWADNYGTAVSTSTKTLPCEDGSKERFRIVSPSVRTMLEFETDEDYKNWKRRWEFRKAEAELDWVCGVDLR